MEVHFFFSSRRRHTRFDCDWSSDVCSSDLAPWDPGEITDDEIGRHFKPAALGQARAQFQKGLLVELVKSHKPTRSEERRVGKEGRYRRSPYHEKILLM